MTRFASMFALAVALLGCTNDTRGMAATPGIGVDTGYPPETALTSLSEEDGIALCEAGSAWVNDNSDLVRLASVSQALQSEDPARCEDSLALYASVSTDATGDVPVFSEGCSVVGVRLASCPQTVGMVQELFEWMVMDVDYRNSMLSCDIADMPDVWHDIAWTDRTPADLQPLRDCMLGT